jgi:hypothetical protein
MRLPFQRKIRHPFYPDLKTASAAAAKPGSTAVAGTVAELLKAGDDGTEVARAVFPLQDVASPFLSARQRDRLWSMFEVPVMAMLVDRRGSVVGYECEMQEGFHLDAEFAAGLHSELLESTCCECGRPGPRLMPPAEERISSDEVEFAEMVERIVA